MEKSAYEISPNLWIGDKSIADDNIFMDTYKINIIINITSNIPNYFSSSFCQEYEVNNYCSKEKKFNKDIDYFHVPIEKDINIEISDNKTKELFDLLSCFINIKKNNVILILGNSFVYPIILYIYYSIHNIDNFNKQYFFDYLEQNYFPILEYKNKINNKIEELINI